MKFSFIAKHRGIWAVSLMCGALGVSRGGFYAWLTRPRSRRSRSDEELEAKVRGSFLGSDRTYGARRVWRDLLAEGMSCGLHRIERLMRSQALKARPRRRRLPPDLGERRAGAVAPNVLDRTFEASAPNRKWIADFDVKKVLQDYADLFATNMKMQAQGECKFSVMRGNSITSPPSYISIRRGSRRCGRTK